MEDKLFYDAVNPHFRAYISTSYVIGAEISRACLEFTHLELSLFVNFFAFAAQTTE